MRHRNGTITIEGGEVVIRTTGREVRLPVTSASARLKGTDLDVFRLGVPVQTLAGVIPMEARALMKHFGDDNEVPQGQPEPRVEVKTYRSAAEYERDATARVAAGWTPQGQARARGKINMGRTLVKGALFLPWALMRPSRQGDPVTVTWVRD